MDSSLFDDRARTIVANISPNRLAMLPAGLIDAHALSRCSAKGLKLVRLSNASTPSARLSRLTTR
jgi:hypothetical protein